MRKMGIGVVVLSVVLLAIPAAAQMGAGNIVKVYFLKAKPGAEKAFEEGLKKHLGWHRAEKDPWAWVAWQTITGEANGMYGVGTFERSWEDFDRDVSSQPAHEADVEANIGPHVASVTPTFWAYLKDVSRPPAEGAETPLSQVLTFRLHFGKADEFGRIIRKITDALNKANWGMNYEWYALVNGGAVPTYVLVLPRANFAAMAPPAKSFVAAMEEAIGRQETEELLEGFEKCIKSETTEIIRSRPDLGYVPGPK